MRSSWRTHGRIAGARDTDLKPTEQANVRVALRFLRTRCGGWEAVSKVLRFNSRHLSDVSNGRSSATASMAVRIARLAKVEIEALLTGCYPAPDLCPHCGQRVPVETPVTDPTVPTSCRSSHAACQEHVLAHAPEKLSLSI